MILHPVGRRAAEVVEGGLSSRHRTSAVRRRISGLTIAALVAVLMVAVPATSPAHAATESQAHKYHKDVKTIFDGTNTIRKSAKETALKYDARITIVSYDWSVSMANTNKMAHNPNYSKQIPKKWTRAGENVAYACGYGNRSAQIIVDAWKNSPGHYANMIGDFTSIGIGVHWDGNCMWATQNFGKYANAPSYALPAKSRAASSVSAAKASTAKKSVNHSAKYKKEIAAAKKASSAAEKSRKAAHKALNTAKKSRDTAKSYANSKRSTKKTKAEHKKAAAEYRKANADYKRARTAASKAKSQYKKVASAAKAGKPKTVNSGLKKVRSHAKSAKSWQKKVTAHQKQVTKFTANAKKARR